MGHNYPCHQQNVARQAWLYDSKHIQLAVNEVLLCIYETTQITTPGYKGFLRKAGCGQVGLWCAGESQRQYGRI